MQTSYQCKGCQSASIHKELFTELHLAIPDEQKSKEDGPLRMQQLVANYLAPEALEDDNKYHCDKCDGLQDAVKTINILEGPDHLMCTLMRFKYDRSLHRKSKIFTDIDYELILDLPVNPEETDGQLLQEKYALYGMVVHSGYSSDGGHYYTYAREPKTDFLQKTENNEEENGDDTWFVFNDSRVSFATFDSFRNVSKRFPRDTAYLLFYRKQNEAQPESGNGNKTTKRRPLRADLKMAVEKDNLNFIREKEKSKRSVSNTNVNWNLNSRRPEDEDDNGSGGVGGCGGGGLDTTARLVF